MTDYQKWLRPLLTAGFIGASGCVGYPGEFAVETSSGDFAPVPYEPAGYCSWCSPYLDVVLSWDVLADYGSTPRCSNVDLAVLTPYGAWIDPYSADADGCMHLGNDPGSLEGGYEEIICDNPASGRFEIHVLNDSCSSIAARVSFRHVHGYPGAPVESQFDRELDLGPSGAAAISVTLD